MAKLIHNGRVVADDWQIVRLEADADPAGAQLPAGRVIVPLALWRARRDELAARGDVAVWLGGADDPAELAADLARLPLVGVDFPKFADGRGYSIAVLLRGRYGYTGELRAIGDVLRDQFNYLVRCGFDALAPREGRYTDAQLEAAVASLADFTEPYQGAIAPHEPLFRRVRRAA